jgi:hypothetical protein
MGLADLWGIADLHSQKLEGTKWLKQKLRATLGNEKRCPPKMMAFSQLPAVKKTSFLAGISFHFRPFVFC